MLNDCVFKLKQKVLLLGVIGILLSTLISVFAFNTPSYAYITKAECEAKGGSWIPGNPNMSTSCNFKYSPADQLRSFSYYTALSSCLRNGNTEGALLTNQMSTRISAADINNPDKWMGGNTISTGYLIDGQDGEQQCSTMIRPALDLWGYNSNTYNQFLDSLGYSGSAMTCTGSTSYDRTCKPSTGGDVSANTTGDQMFNAFRNTIRNRAYAGSNPTLDGRPDLIYLRGNYHIEAAGACSAQPFKKVADLTADEKNTYKNNDLGPPSQNNGWKDYLIVSLVNGENWKREDWVYKINPDRFIKLIKLNEKTNGGSESRTCINLARDSGANADAVARDAAQMIANGQNPADKYNGIVVTPGASGGIGGGSSAGSGDPTTTTTCNIEGLGWILCPVMTFMAGVTDAAYGFVSGLLDVKPLLITGEDQGIYGAWSVMRNIANVAFVIAFLIIIFSQLTSIGVSNYGIKKLLPRLVVAAILVNISYWICAVAVDLSNIAGSSMKGIFDNLQNDLGIQVGVSPFDSGEGWLGFVGGILAAAGITTAIMYLHMSVLIPALIAAVVAIVTVFIVLTLRQALIILLIVIAPLAFVAYLLPNTEDLFNKWRKLLMTLLLMYPIIAGLFGVSALASQIVMGSSDDFAIDVMGALISILPLAITPLVMKFAGGVLNRFGGIVNNVEKGPIDGLKKAGDRYRTGKLNEIKARGLNGNDKLPFRGRFSRFRGRREAIYSGRENEAKDAQRDYVSEELGRNTAFATAVAAGDETKGQRLAAKAKASLEAEDLKAALEPLVRELAEAKALGQDPDTFLLSRANDTNRTQTERSAAIYQAANLGRDGVIRNLQTTYANNPEMSMQIQQSIQSNAGSLVNKAPDLVKGDRTAFGSVNGKELAAFSKGTVQQYTRHLEQLRTSDPAEYASAMSAFKGAVQDIVNSPQLQGDFKADAGMELTRAIQSSPQFAQDLGRGTVAQIKPDGKIR